MALVTISGFPACGKTTRAHQLKKLFDSEQSLPVFIINDESLGLAKSSYDNAAAEKKARGALTGSVQRTLRKDRIVICDALNYIKGFRYQLHVLARELGCRVLTVHVAAPPNSCREWNASRDSTLQYKATTLEELLLRYEEPSYAVRWDTPLVVVPHIDEELPKPAIMDAILSGAIKPPTPAAAQRVNSTTDYLQIVDTAINSVIKAILTAQTIQSGGPIKFRVGDFASTLSGPADGRSISAATLQRHKRAFVALTKQSTGRQELPAAKIVELFATYLEEQVR